MSLIIMYGIIQLDVLMVSFSSKNSLPNGYDAILVGDMKYNGNNYGLSNYTEARGIISPNEGKKIWFLLNQEKGFQRFL
ncbi:hypothetical protein LPB88_21645 [Flavobacterium sp. JAS]|nr:hypothetical protein [Flavobacterium sp. JAS]MCD0472355.1 hypothetical protein [Flavobacterium sp. JAS]